MLESTLFFIIAIIDFPCFTSVHLPEHKPNFHQPATPPCTEIMMGWDDVCHIVSGICLISGHSKVCNICIQKEHLICINHMYTVHVTTYIIHIQ